MKSDYEIVTMDATERQMWRYPLTSVLTLFLACSFAGGLIYTFAFTDTSREALSHASVSLAVIVTFGLLLALAKKMEERKILPRWFRRAIWVGIIALYAAVTALLFLVPGGGPLDRTWLALKLGSLGVLPFLAWRLLKDPKA